MIIMAKNHRELTRIKRSAWAFSMVFRGVFPTSFDVFRKSRTRLSAIFRNISFRLSTEKGGLSGLLGVFSRLSAILGSISERLSLRLSRSFADLEAYM